MNWVPKRGNYTSFKDCCLNYTDDMEIFPEYEPMPDGNGYYSIDEDCKQVEPDSTVQYHGKYMSFTKPAPAQRQRYSLARYYATDGE